MHRFLLLFRHFWRTLSYLWAITQLCWRPSVNHWWVSVECNIYFSRLAVQVMFAQLKSISINSLPSDFAFLSWLKNLKDPPCTKNMSRRKRTHSFASQPITRMRKWVVWLPSVTKVLIFPSVRWGGQRNARSGLNSI